MRQSLLDFGLGIGRTQGGTPSVITLESVGPQDGETVPIVYTISRNDPTVQVVIYDASEPFPTAADFGGANPTYVDQGTVSLTEDGGTLNLEIVGTFDGSVRIALLPTGGKDEHVVVSAPFTLAANIGWALLAQSARSASFVSTDTVSFTGTAGETFVLVLTYTSTHLPTSITIDPGGPNETALTVRASGSTNSNAGVLADAVWPATGALNVRVNYASGVNNVIWTGLSAKAKTHQASQYHSSSSAVPENHVVTQNTTAGHLAIMSVVLANSAAITLTSGVDQHVGSSPLATGTRTAHVLKKDGVAGGTPETFRVDWPSINNVVSGGILGIYG